METKTIRATIAATLAVFTAGTLFATRTLSISEWDNSHFTFSFGATDGSAYKLFLARGAEDGGDDKYAWDTFTSIADIASDQTTYTYNVPAALRDGRPLRFFLMQTAGINMAEELKSVKCTGSQRVDTGIKPGTTTEVDFRFGNVTSTATSTMFGQGFNTSQYLLVIQGSFQFWGSGAAVGPRPEANTDYRCVIDNNNNLYFTAGDVTQRSSISRAAASNVNLFLFAWSGNDYRGSFSFYGMKIRQNGRLVRDFVPARNSSNVAGLYDNVNNVFYTSNTGTQLVTGDAVSDSGRFGRVLNCTATFRLPPPLAHRWSFNGEGSDFTDSVTGTSAQDVFGSGTAVTTGGKLVLTGNAWCGGSLNLGQNLLGTGDATVEIWASHDAVRTNSAIFSYSDQSYGTAPQNEATFRWDVSEDWKEVVFKSSGTERFSASDTLLPLDAGKQYYFAFTFHDNGNGSTTVRWQRRDQASGLVEMSNEQVVPNWTLAGFASGNPNFGLGVAKDDACLDACASYDEVRIWHGVLTDEQLAANAISGPDAPYNVPLAHRWSFNKEGTDFADYVTGAMPNAIFGSGTTKTTAGTLKLTGNNWGGGSLSLGQNLLDTGNATVEIWASHDAARANSVIFSYADGAYSGSSGADEATFRWDVSSSWKEVVFRSSSTDRYTASNTLLPLETGKQYYFAFTFHDNGDGSTTVRWQRRDVLSGELEKTNEQIVPNWTLAGFAANNPNFGLGVAKNIACYDAYASYDEVRIWNRVLNDDKLAANAASGPGDPYNTTPPSASWTGAVDASFATPGNWSGEQGAATSLTRMTLDLPAGASQTFTYVGYDPVSLPYTEFVVNGAAEFPEVGGFYLKSLSVGGTGSIRFDPVKFTFRLVNPPTFESGAKIALVSKYTANTKGRFLLMTWNSGSLDMDAAALNAIFDTTSANGADVKVWAENLETGGRLWLDLDYSAAKQHVNVLCVGDSITHGNSSTFGNGRIFLMKKLAAEGYDPVAKGFRRDQSDDICGSVMPENWVRHAGISGQRLITVTGGFGTLDNIEATLDQAGDVDFVFLLLGINDIYNTSGLTAEWLFSGWQELVWKILNQKPHAKVVAGAVLDVVFHSARNQTVVSFNTMMRNAIEGDVFPANRVYFSDLYTACYRGGTGNNYIVGSFYEPTDVHPDWPGYDKLTDAYIATAHEALTDDPGFALGAAETDVPTSSGAENNVPAEFRSGFTRARTLDIVAYSHTNLAALGYVPYTSVNDAAPTNNLSRVAYYIELKRKNDAQSDFHGLTRWLWVSMDAFGDFSIDSVGVPLTKVSQTRVGNMHIKTNMPGIESTAPNAAGVEGWVEFWPSSYSDGACGQSDAPANTRGYDWNDTYANNMSGWGCMQVHRITPGARNPAQVMFAFNSWTTSLDWEIGLGNFANLNIGSIDWTITSDTSKGVADTMSAAAYEVAKMEIWTEEARVWTGEAGDGKFSTPGNWKGGQVPSGGVPIYFAGAGGVLDNDIDGLDGCTITFMSGAGAFTIDGNALTNVTKVLNVSGTAQTFANEVFFAGMYRVTSSGARVAFPGGATATHPDNALRTTSSTAATRTLDGTFTFTEDWIVNDVGDYPWIIVSNAVVRGQLFTGTQTSHHRILRIDQGGSAYFTTVTNGWSCGDLDIDGYMEVSGEMIVKTATGGTVEARFGRNGNKGAVRAYMIAKCQGSIAGSYIPNLFVGAGGFGCKEGTGADSYWRFNVNTTVTADDDFECLGAPSSGTANGGLHLNGKTVTFNVPDGVTVVNGIGIQGNGTLKKTGLGVLVMTDTCNGQSGTLKTYLHTLVDAGTLVVAAEDSVGTGTVTVNGGATLKVLEAGSFGGASADIADGAMIDLSDRTTALSIQGSLDFADNATVKIKLRGRKTSSRIPIIDWTGNTPDNLDVITFKCAEGETFSVIKRNDGLYVQKGCIIIFR